MPYFLALDAGGTKTQCWLADDERVLGQGAGGTVKLMNVGEEVATHELRTLMIETAERAGVDLQQVQCSCMGLAGVSSEAVQRWAKESFRDLVSGDLLLVGDEEIALDAAFRDGPGVLVIAGTGSNVVGRCTDETRVTAGGWGPVVGDEGSGTWIGIEAIRAGLRALDRGKKSVLLRESQSFWELASLGELIAKVNGRPRAAFAELTTVVAACADGGDELALDVLQRAGKELGEQVCLVLTKMLSFGCSASDGRQVAYAGSVLEKIPRVRQAMEDHMRGKFPDTALIQEAANPLEGALWRARRGT